MTQSALTLERPFSTLSALIARHAAERGEHPALIEGERQLNYREMNAAADRVAFTLQQAGIRPGQAIAICALNSINYALLFIGALRAGIVVAPLAPSSTAESLRGMIRDADAQLVFVDAGC